MPHELHRILQAVALTPWAISEERLQTILGVLLRRDAEGPAAEALVAERLLQPDADWQRGRHRLEGFDHPDKFAEGVPKEAAARPRRSSNGQVAVVPLIGLISNRIHQVQQISGPGGTSAEAFANQVRQAAANPDVKAIVLDVDSPGGTVDGVPEAAQAVFDARDSTHVVAVANSNAHSAAYWIAAQADRVVVTPSGMAGHIGVRTAHVDQTAALEAKGLKVTTISAGRYKSELLPWVPLSDEAEAALQDRVNASYAMFVGDVARGRGVKPADVRNGFGEGRSVDAKEAVRTGIADAVATMGEELARLGVGREAAQPASSTAGDATARRAELAERGLAVRRLQVPRA